jgi:hypothetical protein
MPNVVECLKIHNSRDSAPHISSKIPRPAQRQSASTLLGFATASNVSLKKEQQAPPQPFPSPAEPSAQAVSHAVSYTELHHKFKKILKMFDFEASRTRYRYL